MKYINIFHASNVYNNALLNLAIQLSNGHHRCKYSSRSFLFVSPDVVSSGHRNARQIVSLNLHLHSTVAVHRSSQLLYTTALEPSETSCEHAIYGVETEVERTTRAAPMLGGIAPPRSKWQAGLPRHIHEIWRVHWKTPEHTAFREGRQRDRTKMRKQNYDRTTFSRRRTVGGRYWGIQIYGQCPAALIDEAMKLSTTSQTLSS